MSQISRKKREFSSGLDRKQEDLLIQQQVQQEAVKLSIEHELGTLKSEKQPRKPVFPRLSGRIFSLLMLFCAIISLVLPIAFIPNDFPSIMGIFMLVLFIVMICLLVRSHAYPLRHSREFLYEQGWISVKCKGEKIVKTYAVNWHDVAIVWHVTTKGDAGTNHCYMLQDYQGNLLEGSPKEAKEGLDIWPAFSEQVTLPYLFPQVLFAYEQGLSIPFGPLAVSKRGIVYKGKLLSWKNFGDLEPCDLSGILSISHRTAGLHKRTWVAIHCDDIPNIALLHHLIRFHLYSSNPEPGRISISSVPARPVVNRRVTIIYSGHLIFSARSITMHWGYNNWNDITDAHMTLQHNGTWKVTITVPSRATELNMAFHDQSNTWDSNGSNNYNLGVRTLTKSLFQLSS